MDEARHGDAHQFERTDAGESEPAHEHVAAIVRYNLKLGVANSKGSFPEM